LLAALVTALVAAAFWHHDHEALGESRAQVVASELQPIAVLLKEDQATLKELETEPFAEKDAGVLESYLAKIQRDGVAKNAAMKQRLDQLAENNTAIVTLIKAYASHGKMPVFVTEADKFRNYASAWRDRWNSVMELSWRVVTIPCRVCPSLLAFLQQSRRRSRQRSRAIRRRNLSMRAEVRNQASRGEWLVADQHLSEPAQIRAAIP
jgi:hypothetical protein